MNKSNKSCMTMDKKRGSWQELIKFFAFKLTRNLERNQTSKEKNETLRPTYLRIELYILFFSYIFLFLPEPDVYQIISPRQTKECPSIHIHSLW